jgi:hypothetical protein
VIGSRDARTFLDRGSRLPDALIFSASRPIKHCTKRCPRRSPRSAEDNFQGRCSFTASGVFGSPRSKLSASGNVAATKIYETLTSAQPSSAFRVCRVRVSSLIQVSARSHSLSDLAGEPDLHLTLRRSVELIADLPAKPSIRSASFTSSVLTAQGSCATQAPPAAAGIMGTVEHLRLHHTGSRTNLFLGSHLLSIPWTASCALTRPNATLHKVQCDHAEALGTATWSHYSS